MNTLQEMLEKAQECANEADALRKCVTEISLEVGKIANLSGGYLSEDSENMRESRFGSGEKFTERIIVEKGASGYELRVETWLGWISNTILDPEEFFDESNNTGIHNRNVNGCSIRELQFIVDNIEGFLLEWYEHLKKQHATRKQIRLTAEKIAASFK
jgi:hypothetical protein